MKEKESGQTSDRIKTKEKEKGLSTVRSIPVNTAEFDWAAIVNQFKLIPNLTLREINLPDEKLFQVFIFLLKKQIKLNTELSMISMYLQTYPNFVNIMKKGQVQDMSEILTRVSFYITLEVLERNSVLFRTGDKGDKFYIILSGRVAILVAKDLKVRMSEKDYLKHLLKLKQLNEHEILTKTIQTNRHIYEIDEETLDLFIRNSALSGEGQTLRKSFIKPSTSGGETANYKKMVLRTSQFNDIMKFQERLTGNNSTTPSLFFNPNKVTIEDYINITRPNKEHCSTSKSVPEITTWEYFHILTRNTGDTFGEVALELVSQKRTATIIAIEDCNFGYLSKEIYNECIREANERTRRNNINFILNSQIFKGLNKQVFEKKNVFNLFINCQVTNGDVLLEDGAEAENIYLLKTGEYQVHVNKTLHELNLLIKEFGGSFDVGEDMRDFPNEYAFNKYFSQKFKFKLSIVKDKDVIGLNDYIYKNKFFSRVHCTSNGEAFKLSRKFYESFAPEEKVLKDNNFEYMKMKKNILLDKLIKFKKFKITSFANKNKESLIIWNTRKFAEPKPDLKYTQKLSSNNILLNMNKSDDNNVNTKSSISSKKTLPFQNKFILEKKSEKKVEEQPYENREEGELMDNVGREVNYNNQSPMAYEYLNSSNCDKYSNSSSRNDSNFLNVSDFITDKKNQTKLSSHIESSNNFFTIQDNDEQFKPPKYKIGKLLLRKMNYKTNYSSNLAHSLYKRSGAIGRYQNTSTNMFTPRSMSKDKGFATLNVSPFKTTFGYLKKSFPSNSGNRLTDCTNTTLKDKEILNNFIDKLVDNSHFNSNKSSSPFKKKINVIDFLVLDKMIESSQTISHNDTYFHSNNLSKSQRTHGNSLNTLLTKTSSNRCAFTLNKQANFNTILSTPKLNYRDRSNSLIKNKAKTLYSSNLLPKHLKSNFHTINTEKIELDNLYFDRNLTATTTMKNFRAKKYKLVNLPLHK